MARSLFITGRVEVSEGDINVELRCIVQFRFLISFPQSEQLGLAANQRFQETILKCHLACMVYEYTLK